MKRFLAYTLTVILCCFSLTAKSWWVPECNDSNHKHEYHEYVGFQLCYEEDYEQPMFVSYHLTNAQITGYHYPRKDSFAEDKSIKTGSATLADYRNSGYSRGHLAPNGDMNYSLETQKECFLLSNMSPQEQNYFNGGIWEKAESAVQTIGATHDDVIVITGPILDKKTFQTIGGNRVAIPEDFYKIAVFIDDGKVTEVYAVIMSQVVKLGSVSSLKYNDPRFLVTIDDIEKRTGLDFFASLDDKCEDAIENVKYGQKVSIQIIKESSSNSNYNKPVVTPTVEEAIPPTKNVVNISFPDLSASNITLLNTKLKNRMYISNIAKKQLFCEIDAVYYYIGKYGFESFINGYPESSSVKIIYYELDNMDIINDYIKEGFSLDDIANDFGTTKQNLLINIGANNRH